MSACLFIKFENKHSVKFVQTGRRMLNTCPPEKSCGTWYPIWTDEEAPEDVLSPAAINVYASYYQPGGVSSWCKYNTHLVEVMRCSLDTDYDLIYRYIGGYISSCDAAFCGMS